MAGEIVKRGPGEVEPGEGESSSALAPAGFDLQNVGYAGVASCPICLGSHKVTKNTLDGMPVFVMVCPYAGRKGIRMLGVPADAIRTGGHSLTEAFRRQLQVEQERERLLAAPAVVAGSLPPAEPGEGDGGH